MNNYECIFLDRDGTINHDPGYISDLCDFKFFDFALPTLKELSRIGYKFCIITNQSGVGRGLIKEKKLGEIHQYIQKEFSKNNISLLGIYTCTDHPNQASKRRKPDTGMFLEAMDEHGFNLKKCLVIGDSIVDIKAGCSLGMDTMLVLTGLGLKTKTQISGNLETTYVVESLKESLEILCP